jgi:hypothetical protein
MGHAICNVSSAPKAVYKLVLANAQTIVILDEPQGLDPESILILGIQDGIRITCAARVRNDVLLIQVVSQDDVIQSNRGISPQSYAISS